MCTGGKCSCWEGGLRATAFVSSPLLPAGVRGTTLQSLMHAVDVLPTLLGAAFGSSSNLFTAQMAAQGRPLDGVNYWPYLTGVVATAPRTQLLMEADPHFCCQPGGDSRFCGDQHGSDVGSGYFAFRKNNWKLIIGDPSGGEGDGWFCSGAPCNHSGSWVPSPTNLTSSSIQLYDVGGSDPSETNNQAAAQPKLVEELKQALKKYNATGLFQTSFICAVRGPFQVRGALTPWCAEGGNRSGCTKLINGSMDA
jgi:hypothetical protein